VKAHLLFADRDPATVATPLQESADMVRDLGLGTLFDTMAGDDPFVREVAAQVVLRPLENPAEIEYRHEVLIDCLAHPAEVHELYHLAVQAAQSKRRIRSWLATPTPSSVLHHAIALLEELQDQLLELRRFSAANARLFTSPAFKTFFAMVDRDLDDAYLALLKDHVRRLRFPSGEVMTASVDQHLQGRDHVLRKPQRVRRTWREVFGLGLFGQPGVYTYRLPERDEAGARTLGRIRDRGLNRVADAAAQSADHVLDFFGHLCWELAFYVGCIRLHDAIHAVGAATCIPQPRSAEAMALSFRGIRDVGLVLRAMTDVVPNDLDADHKTVIMITGANEGGKSTLLRALGMAQLMAQCGLFVTADSFTSSVTSGIHTHYRREEDAEMTSGKLDEELKRMSGVVDAVRTHGLVLFNESFACTNEREGSEIGHTIVRALQGSGVRVVYVTHMYALASALAAEDHESDLFLRAGRLDSGRRTFKVTPGAPETTSFGRDLYDEIFTRQTVHR
jgi:DNA mismatch repair ATPase MutS